VGEKGWGVDRLVNATPNQLACQVSSNVMLNRNLSNAAPEWQAMNLRWPGGELVVACPLKGLVRSAQILSDLVNSFLVAEI